MDLRSHQSLKTGLQEKDDEAPLPPPPRGYQRETSKGGNLLDRGLTFKLKNKDMIIAVDSIIPCLAE